MSFRIGFGFDVHPLVEGRKLMLGGVEIPHHKGCDGHSDADVLLHAICDALLGAAGLRDIGHHFPNSDAQYKGADSKLLLKHTLALIKEKGYRVGNIDCTLCLEEPKINPHIDKMKEAIAPILEVSKEAISIKATTNEGLGYVGTKNGANAYAVALIEGVVKPFLND
jgi:2-C-methyl-D-erythritol 2,4-cyclodiphosphate synthase